MFTQSVMWQEVSDAGYCLFMAVSNPESNRRSGCMTPELLLRDHVELCDWCYFDVYRYDGVVLGNVFDLANRAPQAVKLPYPFGDVMVNMLKARGMSHKQALGMLEFHPRVHTNSYDVMGKAFSTAGVPIWENVVGYELGPLLSSWHAF